MATINFFYRSDNQAALVWEKKIKQWLKKKHPRVRVVNQNGQFVIVLGGDGTILEAARKYQNRGPIIFGLNLGQVGFLATVREEKKFLPGLDKLFQGQYRVVERMMLRAEVRRNNKAVFSANALNEVVAQSLIGLVDLKVLIDGGPIQDIRGTGVLIATATGSTSFNLSAHGPILTPDMEGFIVTELMDHNIPSPSLVVKNKQIQLKVTSFRERGLLSVAETGERVDVVLISDGTQLFPLKEGDLINITRSPKLARFVEIEKNYFFKSLHEKFSFK